MRKNEKHVILCLLEVARRGAKFGKFYTKNKITKMDGKNIKLNESYSFSIPNLNIVPCLLFFLFVIVFMMMMMKLIH